MSELERRVDAIMARVPAQYRYRPWCHAPACACSGCVNGAGGVSGKITESMWRRWVLRHDRRSGSDRRSSGPLVWSCGFEGPFSTDECFQKDRP